VVSLDFTSRRRADCARRRLLTLHSERGHQGKGVFGSDDIAHCHLLEFGAGRWCLVKLFCCECGEECTARFQHEAEPRCGVHPLAKRWKSTTAAHWFARMRTVVTLAEGGGYATRDTMPMELRDKFELQQSEPTQLPCPETNNERIAA
jgi:hypothetical protein